MKYGDWFYIILYDSQFYAKLKPNTNENMQQVTVYSWIRKHRSQRKNELNSNDYTNNAIVLTINEWREYNY